MKLSDGYELDGFVAGNNRVATARDGESDAEAEARQQEADQKAAAIAAEEDAGEYRLVYSTGTTTTGTGLLQYSTTVLYYPFTFQDCFCTTAVQPYVYGSTAGTTV
jgi:hypothetical protein